MTGSDELIRDMRRTDVRYEAELADGSRAVLEYREEGGRILFTYTGTPPHQRHRGVAARLTRFALDDAIARGFAIVPVCGYTEWFIERHPEYAAHLADGAS